MRWRVKTTTNTKRASHPLSDQIQHSRFPAPANEVFFSIFVLSDWHFRRHGLSHVRYLVLVKAPWRADLRVGIKLEVYHRVLGLL